MKKCKVYFLALALLVPTWLLADEGMWIPSLLQQLNEKEMQQMGLRLSAADIYSVNQSSLKDAILLFGGGCTAEIISMEGLILTNHHCGFGEIQKHSSLEKDYLTLGFWASRKEEELSNPGLTAEMLIRMEDVTSQVLEGVLDHMGEFSRDSLIEVNSKKIIGEATKDSHYSGKVRPFYYGNVYYLFITEIFKDIRLVGAPPSGIGKFGGDTDNWMWPRHTGDFSVFRIYVGKDNKPAEYSLENVPYQPRKSLTISLKGYDKGDFTFVYGYPGRTQQFITSWAVDLVTSVENPVRIKLRQRRLDVIKQYMDKDPLTRIQYAAKAAGIANGWKKWIGESKGLKRLQTIQQKKEQEIEFQNQVMQQPQRKQQYQNLLQSFENIHKAMTPLDQAYIYYQEAGQSIELVRLAGRFTRLLKLSMDKETGPELIKVETKHLKEAIKGFYKNYNPAIDRECMPYLLSEYSGNVDPAYLPGIFQKINGKHGKDFEQYTAEVFRESLFPSEEKLNKFLDNYKASHYKKLLKDPVYELAASLSQNFYDLLLEPLSAYRDQLDSLQRCYVKARMEMLPDKRYYPDANLTLRVAYGQVKDYYPMDAVHYEYFTTLSGILEKEDPSIYDYTVSEKLKSLHAARDYGHYGDKDGSLHTCFIATNHTTGGNSGSPVFNGEGHLIGINFDRNWEGTMSDIHYDVNQCRNITLDIRYCLFVIDKVCGAGHLIQEMNLVR